MQVAGQTQTKVLEIDDPLTNSSTKGGRVGGQFTAEGWKTVETFDHIQYNIPTCSAGEVQFDVTGIYASNEVFPNIAYDKFGVPYPYEGDVHYALFNMYDRDDDQSWYGVTQWHNPYKCIMHLYGYTPGDLYKWRYMQLRLNVAAFEGGYDDDPHAFEKPAFGPIDWQRTHVYHFRLVWGDGLMQLYIDGELRKQWDYSSFGELYAPPDHSFRIGSGAISRSGGFKAPIGITFSNLKFYRYVDTTPPKVTDMEPVDDGSGVSVDSDIFVTFSEAMDEASAEAAFSITPPVAGNLRWISSSLYLQRSELLQPSTTYTVQVDTGARDVAGIPLITPFTAQFTSRALSPSVVKKWDVFEVTLTATGLGNVNRYRDITLQGTFQGPTKTITIEGFWDGSDIWKVRMAPNEVGPWTYQITSSVAQLRTSGSFNCIDSDLPGFIRVSPSRPHTFMYDDGTPWLWLGDTAWRGYTSQIPYESRWKYLIDLRAQQGYTAIQSIVVSYINGLNFWKNEGGTCFYETSTIKDYDYLNPGYFRWIDKRINYALSKNIIPVIFFTWAQEYTMFSESQFSKFVRYLVARYAAKNVIWIICGEYNELPGEFPGRTTDEFDTWGRLIKEKDPYDHPISLHPTGRTSSGEFGYTTWMDFIGQQTPYYIRDIERDHAYGKPVVNLEPRYFYPVEYGGGPNSQSRVALWQIITAGGFYTSGFYTTFAPDKGGWDPGALPDEQRWVEILNKYLPNVPWHQMDPHSSWISSGSMIAKGGEAYLAYNSSGGPVTINLTTSLGSLPARWLNPRDGSFSDPFTVKLGASTLLTPPFEGDWALYIGEELLADEMPPLPPEDLTAESSTIKSIKLSWNAPPPAEDGDGADKYILFRNDEKIATTSETTYTDSNLEEGTQYNYSVFALDDAGNQSLTAATGQFQTLSDMEPPILTRVRATAQDTLVAYFSEAVDSLSAIDVRHYQILQGLAIYSAKLLPDKSSVKLHTAQHEENKYYSLIARKIFDRATRSNCMGPNNVQSYRYGVDFEVGDPTPSTYQWAYLHVGDEYYMDRTLTLLDIPVGYQNLLWLKTKNDDKEINEEPFITFTITAAATIYIAYDESVATVPAWLNTWTRTDDRILTTDDVALVIYEKYFTAGSVEMGGNAGGHSKSMYVVLVKPDQTLITGDQPIAPNQVKIFIN
ncbi:DUF4038 domain-containing protein [candidate division KSB1 bacterium]|nr:DUF4038 domain-containing protein [candidate division KSB1 bacterium]